MKTINLDKLLAELELRMAPLGFAPDNCIIKGVINAREWGGPAEKISAFTSTRDVMAPPVRWGHRRAHAADVAGFCEAVIFYYMLKGANLEHDIINHEQLNVIMEVLK